MPIFEDECYADLTWSGKRRRRSTPGRARGVIHIGSFSKSIAPALRVGYVVADWEFSPACSRQERRGTGALEQMVVAEYFCRSISRTMCERSTRP